MTLRWALYRPPGRYVCADCEASPMMLDLNGHCGRPTPGLLPILVGEGADRCPTAAVEEDPDVVRLMDLVPGPHGPGLLSGMPRHALPPFYRRLMDEAEAWLATWRAQLKEVVDERG